MLLNIKSKEVEKVECSASDPKFLSPFLLGISWVYLEKFYIHFGPSGAHNYEERQLFE